ncbi:hypothetical protein CDV36_012993 [Fusarium kuroshium]|uniref:PD-(D/E)XK nuclease-like domain-containing protein n=1 Tax=Fusarium kuroshium TaxID=2010991 RepID=A0A3M2RRF2_9HYPO|nr:hypothetical protein CDV36_012993 [Fusarium kuroshium]
MKDVYVIENHQDGYRFVYSWLETVDLTPPQTLFTRPVKRLKINKVHRQDSTRRCNGCEILTPSHSSLSDSAYSDDEESVYEQTPKASRQGDGLRGWRRDDRSRSGRSTPSLASSSAASGASSPTKQFRYAEKQETGFQPLNFEPNIHRLPPSLKSLRRSLNSISFGEAILPLELREKVEELGDFPQFAFFDSQTQSTKWRIPPTALVRQVVKRAVECDQNRQGESSWNMDVHRLLLDFAFQGADNDDLVDYRYCTGAQIVTEYKPKGAPSKMFDFCICIKPQDSSTEARVIESFTGERPGLSINHTDWGNFCKHPIALSI